MNRFLKCLCVIASLSCSSVFGQEEPPEMPDIFNMPSPGETCVDPSEGGTGFTEADAARTSAEAAKTLAETTDTNLSALIDLSIFVPYSTDPLISSIVGSVASSMTNGRATRLGANMLMQAGDNFMQLAASAATNAEARGAHFLAQACYVSASSAYQQASAMFLNASNAYLVLLGLI